MARNLHIGLVLLIFLGIVGVYLLMAVQYPIAYIWATYEDLVGEWCQVFLFVSAFVFAFLVAWRGDTHRLFFAVLAVALFYTFMEEISWGQRVFGWDSPQVFQEYNLQRETNLHNVLVGPYSTITKDVIEYTLALALAVYGLVFPLLLRFGWGPAVWFYERGLAAPPLYLWPFFLVAAWLETAPLRFNEAEVAEILVGFALFVTAAQYWFASKRALAPRHPPAWPAAASLAFSGLVVSGLLVVMSLAALTTYWFYTSDVKGPPIQSRLLNGYEKFADRYDNYDRWDVVADLLLRVHEQEPGRTSVLRRLAQAYEEQGDKQRFQFYTQKALRISLDKYKRNPDKISVNLALSRTYRQLGDTRTARMHGEQAHELALGRVAENPDDAHWAYWLGKTYRHLGQYEEARDQFERAFEIRPSSKKYRKAYYQMRRITGQ